MHTACQSWQLTAKKERNRISRPERWFWCPDDAAGRARWSGWEGGALERFAPALVSSDQRAGAYRSTPPTRKLPE
jgi:hypothetical protein